MIWFTCTQCGKTHGRQDADAGLTVYCDCGRGARVPWYSTAHPPEEQAGRRLPISNDEEEEIPEAIPVPRTRAFPLFEDDDDDEDSHPGPRSRKLPASPPLGDTLPTRKRRTLKRANPAYCFNHDELGSQTVCDDCKLSFCHACVIEFQGRTLCGPCKNFRIRPNGVRPRLSARAVLALVVGLVSGPIGFCLSTMPLTARASAGLTILAVLFALVLPVLACHLGWRALRQFDREPLLGGRGLAVSGTLAGLLGVLWCLTIALVAIVKQTQG